MFLKCPIKVYQMILLGYDVDRIILITCELAVKRHAKERVHLNKSLSRPNSLMGLSRDGSRSQTLKT